MRYQAVEKYGGYLNVYYQEKETNLKNLYTVQPQLFIILETTKLRR
jgi:hypothetical protein